MRSVGLDNVIQAPHKQIARFSHRLWVILVAVINIIDINLVEVSLLEVVRHFEVRDEGWVQVVPNDLSLADEFIHLAFLLIEDDHGVSPREGIQVRQVL